MVVRLGFSHSWVRVLSQTHSESLIRAVEAAESGKPNPGRYLPFGLGTGDNPIFPGIMSAARLYTGGSLDAAGIVADGVSRIVMNISGGLHHAHYARASGFCVFNDCAVAIRRLRERFERVAYVDIDVHHGDGVQELFYSDPSVMTISIHETGLTLYPGTGFPQDIGEAKGRGYSVNIPVWPNTDDALWLESWRSVGLAALTAFDPQAIVLQIGADAHALDPLAHVMLSAQGWNEAISDVVSLETPIVALGDVVSCPSSVSGRFGLMKCGKSLNARGFGAPCLSWAISATSTSMSSCSFAINFCCCAITASSYSTVSCSGVGHREDSTTMLLRNNYQVFARFSLRPNSYKNPNREETVRESNDSRAVQRMTYRFRIG